jgi:hypothetical protein
MWIVAGSEVKVRRYMRANGMLAMEVAQSYLIGGGGIIYASMTLWVYWVLRRRNKYFGSIVAAGLARIQRRKE